MIRVLIVDDQTLVREGFRAIVEAEPDLTVVADAADGTSAVELCASLSPDVVLMDVRMPVMDGIEATRIITAKANGPRVIVLTTFDLDEYVFEALHAGASGFLLKDGRRDELVAAIRTVQRGDSLLAPQITKRLVERFLRSSARPRSPTALADLSDREAEVLRLVASGRSNSEIADALVVSESTVKSHVAHIFQKLDLRDRVHAVVYAYECGFVRAGDNE